MRSLTLDEVREWYALRNHVRQHISSLEVCGRCDRVREVRHLTLDGTTSYKCRGGCEAKLASKAMPPATETSHKSRP